MTKNPFIGLRHILECIDSIEDYLKRFKNYDFFQEQWLQDMVVRRVEIMGEAVKNLPVPLKKKYPQINWKNIGGARDILIHAYDHVDLNVIWDIVQNKLKPLKKQLLKITKDLEKAHT